LRGRGARLLSPEMAEPMSKLKELRARLAEVPDRIATVAKVAQTSGLMWGLTMPGARALANTVRTGARNPSQVYRVHALNSPAKAALKWRDETITFAELDRRIDAIASSLVRRGFGRGTSVLLMMKNRPEFIEAATGISRMGARRSPSPGAPRRASSSTSRPTAARAP